MLANRAGVVSPFMRSHRTLALAAAILYATGSFGAGAQETGGDLAAGRALALQTCAACHLVGTTQTVPDGTKHAPAFSSVANMPSVTARSLYVFLNSPHPSMPNLILSGKEAKDVIAYILSLRTRRSL